MYGTRNLDAQKKMAFTSAYRLHLGGTTLQDRTGASRCAFVSRHWCERWRVSSLRRPALVRPGTGHLRDSRRQPVRALDSGNLPLIGEALELLAATTIVVPLFRRLGQSPILGFLLSGVVLGPHGFRLVKDVADITELAEFGVLFLLFEMGLQLNLARLQKLRRFVFGMGTLQVSLSTAVLGGGAFIMGATIPEAIAVGAALSLSSSAFVLQLLAEKCERATPAGVAATGVLLLQDIATVPALVLIPLLTMHMSLSPDDITQALMNGGKHVVQTLALLNVFVLAGGFLLKQLFTMVAESRSSEAFTSLTLLTVLGTAWYTAELGLPMTLGSFIAGVLLAESSFRSRIMVDMEPFRGLLLGLFFTCTGMTLDLGLFIHRPQEMAFLITSLLFMKTAITTFCGLPVGLSLAESLRVGLLTSQGGEFSFVLFALANKLGFLPDDVNAYLTTTVVATMALTPALYGLGLRLAPALDKFVGESGGETTADLNAKDLGESNEEFCLIFGYGPVGEVVGKMLSRKFVRWVAVDLDIDTVKRSVQQKLPVIYGDSLHPIETLEANGLPKPTSFVVTHTVGDTAKQCIEAVRCAFPDTPVFVRSMSPAEQKEFLDMGAMASYPETLETAISLGACVLKEFEASAADVSAIKREMRCNTAVEKAFADYEANWAEIKPPRASKNGTVEHVDSEEKDVVLPRMMKDEQ